MPINSVWINTPSTVYGANTPISLTDVRKCTCFDVLTTAIEYSGNTPGNTISLVVHWFDQTQTLIFVETLVTDTAGATNDSKTTTIKGAFAFLQILGSVNPTFTASVQAIFKQQA